MVGFEWKKTLATHCALLSGLKKCFRCFPMTDYSNDLRWYSSQTPFVLRAFPLIIVSFFAYVIPSAPLCWLSSRNKSDASLRKNCLPGFATLLEESFHSPLRIFSILCSSNRQSPCRLNILYNERVTRLDWMDIMGREILNIIIDGH